MIDIPLDTEHFLPLYRQIAEHLKKMILAGTLPGQTRLPGSRSLAQAHGISRNTVVEAYAFLEEEGLIFSKEKSGFYVNAKEVFPSQSSLSRRNRDFASELPSTDLLPANFLRSLLREEAGGDLGFFFPSPVAGFLELRKALTRHAAGRGIPALWENVMVTSGVQEGLALALEILLHKGVRRLWVEGLSYPPILDMGKSRGFQIALLPPDWCEWRALEDTLDEKDALYLVPSFQNPTGKTMPMVVRQELLELSRRKKFWIIEDDAYGELRYGDFSVPALKALEGAYRVIYCSSFSQLLFPGIRIGYMLLPKVLWKECCSCKLRNTGHSSALDQKIVFRFLMENRLEDSVRLVRHTIKERMNSLRNVLLSQTGLTSRDVEMPQGGIYLWVPVPEGMSGKEMARKARNCGVLLRGGEDFAMASSAEQTGFVRFSVSSVTKKDIVGSGEKLHYLWKGNSP